MAPRLHLAVAQPRTATGRLADNARAHADLIRRARARLVVFPELSLTGYSFAAGALGTDDGAWTPIVDACAAHGTVALVGAPATGSGGLPAIATFVVDGSGADVGYRKAWLGDAERPHYAAGDEPGIVDVDGWRVGLGICRDTGVKRHVDGMAAASIDLYAAGLVHAPEDLEEQDARGRRIALATGAHVAFASFAGATAEGYDATAGTSTIWSPRGDVLARADAEPGRVADVTIHR
ncbi:carbon-nitrogen hydrolase family protein [Patulibacter minatonensis]|uniref:carbon-nitrogen hydrolase family protein n=1 Tax=Patulibacter minatonensis TaxID=298163 RepID=UPI00047BE795|nr:carbon-nitrogen hydrolase family protein [Patulibacter minatonensis]